MPRRTRSEIEKANRLSAARHASHILKTYGISGEEYNRIYEYQGGRCYICKRANGRTRRLAVDHCHATGNVRGLLCRSCNRMLGHARDDPRFFSRASTYLQFPPAYDIIGQRPVPGPAA